MSSESDYVKVSWRIVFIIDLIYLDHAVAYLLLGELGDAPPFGFVEQFGRCPPLWEVIFWEKTMGYLGTHCSVALQFVCESKNVSLIFLKPPPLKNLRNATELDHIDILYMYLSVVAIIDDCYNL